MDSLPIYIYIHNWLCCRYACYLFCIFVILILLSYYCRSFDILLLLDGGQGHAMLMLNFMLIICNLFHPSVLESGLCWLELNICFQFLLQYIFCFCFLYKSRPFTNACRILGLNLCFLAQVLTWLCCLPLLWVSLWLETWRGYEFVPDGFSVNVFYSLSLNW